MGCRTRAKPARRAGYPPSRAGTARLAAAGYPPRAARAGVITADSTAARRRGGITSGGVAEVVVGAGRGEHPKVDRGAKQLRGMVAAREQLLLQGEGGRCISISAAEKMSDFREVGRMLGTDAETPRGQMH